MLCAIIQAVHLLPHISLLFPSCRRGMDTDRDSRREVLCCLDGQPDDESFDERGRWDAPHVQMTIDNRGTRVRAVRTLLPQCPRTGIRSLVIADIFGQPPTIPPLSQTHMYPPPPCFFFSCKSMTR